ncbi:MAG: 1-deoxy-D-xylulose-5-phosphate synthase [Chlamydiae bacterium]|nr:1-deoxy-D-xylulose-5-phosphate synthase [Chlamydiota bacterium]
MTILSKIHSPKDLKSLSVEELTRLSQEIRQRIIDVMSKNGGHLASNLGVVELTLALHKVFDSPTDKMMWDVSHQTYVHKILTGRNDRFDTIRQYEGLCGFSHPNESPHDHFHAGHAGTAMSLSLGVAKTRDLNDEDFYVIPVIGDATLTCGMSLEALNNLGRDRKKFVIILNDNRMSISKNVGNITKILSRLISNPRMHRMHHKVDRFLEKIPLGKSITRQGRKFIRSLKNYFSSAALLEFFGLSYIGPINGHDIQSLIEIFEGIKDSDNPVLIHVCTNKGHGMNEAVKSPVTHHGAKPFDKVTGKFLPASSKKPTFPKIFGKQILEMADQDPSIVVVTPAMSYGSCLDAFFEKYPDRGMDVGIAESHAVTFSGGLAYRKKSKVVCSIYATFLHRGLDNLFHDVCLQKLPVVFALDRGGLSAADGSTHHGIYDISFMNAMPNMVISQPRDGQLLRELLQSAFSYGHPTAIRYPNMATEDATQPLQLRECGKGEILAEGRGLLIISLGHMNKTAMEVRESLLDQGITATVMDPIFVKPFDYELLNKLMLTHNQIVTLEEHSVTSGLGSVVNNALVQQGFSGCEILNLGIPERFIEHGDYASVIDELGLTPEKVTNRILEHFSFAEVENLSEVR